MTRFERNWRLFWASEYAWPAVGVVFTAVLMVLMIVGLVNG